MSRFHTLKDNEKFEVDIISGEIIRFACCDCGLVHNIAFAIEENGKLGVAMSRNLKATNNRRKTKKCSESMSDIIKKMKKTIIAFTLFLLPTVVPLVRAQQYTGTVYHYFVGGWAATYDYPGYKGFSMYAYAKYTPPKPQRIVYYYWEQPNVDSPEPRLYRAQFNADGTEFVDAEFTLEESKVLYQLLDFVVDGYSTAKLKLQEEIPND